MSNYRKPKLKLNKNINTSGEGKTIAYIPNYVTCFHIFNKGIKINYSIQILKLDQIGKTKINQVICVITDLKFDYLNDFNVMNNIKSLLNEMEFFPYLEIIPVLFDILKSETLAHHQVYITLKIFQEIFFRNQILINKEKDIDTYRKICSKSLNCLFDVYFRHYIFQEFILNLFDVFHKDFGDSMLKFVKSVLYLDGKNTLFYYSVLKFLIHFYKRSNREVYLNENIYKEIRTKISNTIPTTDIEKQIKNRISKK